MLIYKIRFLMLLSIVFVTQTYAQESVKHYSTEKSLMLQGYDPVSYFDGKPLKGSKNIKVTYKTLTFQFSSSLNLKKFSEDPEKYIPSYGGWCAYAMGFDGSKVEVDPETFKIINGKLYLFYNAFFNNTLLDWNKDEKNLKLKADKNWQLLLKK